MINTADFKQVTILIPPQSLFLADVPPSLPPEGLLFRSKVVGHALAWLKREGKARDELIEKLMNWRHSGFSVHAGNRIARDDRDGQKALAEYILRNTYSEQKITYLEDTGKVLYRSPMTHGSNKKNFEIFTAKEFIAAITQHIPDKHFQMVGYYGWYSSRSRGERKKVGLLRPGDQPAPSAATPEVTVPDVSEYKPPRVPSKTRKELIKKVWEVDPLRCPRCGHEMQIISLIHEPKVIERILRVLDPSCIEGGKAIGLWSNTVGLTFGERMPSFSAVMAAPHGLSAA